MEFHSITLTKDEALDLVAVLDDAAATLERYGALEMAFTVTDQLQIMTEKLTE